MKPWIYFDRRKAEGRSVWISGIYKIVSYRIAEYSVYYLQHGDANWGHYVSTPPKRVKRNGVEYGCWASLADAKAAAEQHCERSEPPSSLQVETAERVLDRILDGGWT